MISSMFRDELAFAHSSTACGTKLIIGPVRLLILQPLINLDLNAKLMFFGQMLMLGNTKFPLLSSPYLYSTVVEIGIARNLSNACSNRSAKSQTQKVNVTTYFAKYYLKAQCGKSYTKDKVNDIL